MTLNGQRIQPDRYTLIPRTLCFLLNEERVLLLRLPHDAGSWSGKLNGIGGHIEQGEDPLSSARREIFEEIHTDVKNLTLSGVVTVDTGSSPGIGLYIYIGYIGDIDLLTSVAGSPVWVPMHALEDHPVIEDVPLLLSKALEAFQGGAVFSAGSHYAEDGSLQLHFAE
jgi:8-oxo-dGTP diphosphatase